MLLLSFVRLLCYNSYLRSLVPAFNECVDWFLERLKPLADGKTQVPMGEEFANLTLNIISRVCIAVSAQIHTAQEILLSVMCMQYIFPCIQTGQNVLVHYSTPYILQVAFGLDFSNQTWSDKFLGLKYAKVDGKLTSLVGHTLQGLQDSMYHPFMQVSSTVAANN